MVLVGRSRELAEIGQLLDRALAGSGTLLVLTGPPGSGKTTLVDAAVDQARRRRFDVARGCAVRGQGGRLVWAQLLRDAGASDGAAARLLDERADTLGLDNAARLLTAGSPRLLVVDDIDRGGPDAVGMLAVVAARLAAGPTAVLATAGTALGLGRELRLGGLTENELLAVVGPVREDACHTLWVASRGRPGVARELAAPLAGLPADQDPLVHLAVHAVSEAGFLDVDVALVRLLEAALGRAPDDRTRARVLARLAHELLGDASAGPRRRMLIEEATHRARRSADPAVLAEVADARLHALWDPVGAEDRLAAAVEIEELARAGADDLRERHGVFWRFIALMELGRIGEAESALAAFARMAEAAGDAAAGVMAVARQAMLAILRGRYDEASRLAEEVAESGRRAGVADTDRLAWALRGSIAMERDRSLWRPGVEAFYASARAMPGHFFETTAARILAEVGCTADAAVELDRQLPRVLAGSGPRWLGAVTDLAVVAAATGNIDAAARLHRALQPYRGRLVVWGGANTTTGPVCHYLGLLGTQLGRLDEAIASYQEAIAWEEEVGALPLLAHTMSAFADTLTARSAGGDPAAAGEYRRRARSIADRLGMTALLAELDRAARADDPLTAREREVADLVAAGYTNRQIAEQLVVSERTVESHVRSTFAKLGLTRRTQLAAWALTPPHAFPPITSH